MKKKAADPEPINDDDLADDCEMSDERLFTAILDQHPAPGGGDAFPWINPTRAISRNRTAR